MSAGFEGRVVAVSGAASGIGRATAAALLARGGRVGFADLDGDACAAARAALDPDGHRSIAFTLDVRDRGQTEAFADALETSLGPVDGFVAAAGISRPMAADAVTDEAWAAVIGVNLTGTFIGAQVFGRRMLSRGRGSIVLVGSLSSTGGQPGRAHYCASKAAVAGLGKVLALEWGSRGVRVNTVAPGVIETPLVRKGLPAAFLDTVVTERTPLARLGTAEEVAQCCLFLLGPDSSFVNGALLPVDGGLTSGFLTHRNGLDLNSTALLAAGAYRE